MKKLVEKYVESAIAEAFGPGVVKLAKTINTIAQRQGGKTMAQNYQILGKKVFIGAGAATVLVGVGSIIAIRAVAHRIRKRRNKALPSQASQASQAVVTPAGENAIEQSANTPSFYRRYGKRACDIAIGTVALPVVGAVTIASGIAIKREDGGPVFYNAPRVGKDGKEFTMFKLRSMKVNAPDLVMEDGSTYNGADDPRMTQVGAFLRKTSLDEIPQFLNVLRGDMSVVGPRPDLKRETELYRGDEALKLTVKPGVTGYAAVFGRNSLPWHDRLALDVYYVRNLSFPLDVKVFLKTFSAVFKQEGVFVENESDSSPQTT